MRSLAPKIIDEGITINALAPSIVRTALGPKAFFDKMEAEGRVTPMSTLTDCVDALLDGDCKLTGTFYSFQVTRSSQADLGASMRYVLQVNWQN